MKLTKLSLTFLTFTAAVPLLIAGMLLRGAAQTTPSDHNSSNGSDDSTQVKIARAMSAGPTEAAKAARIVDTDAQGKIVVLREGNNGFTWVPGNLQVVAEPPMCVDAPYRTADYTQGDRRVHHVGRIAVRACAHHGTSIKRFSTSA